MSDTTAPKFPSSSPARYHVPGVISHVRRCVLHQMPLFQKPEAARTVLEELNCQAAIYGVHLHAVVIRKNRYDLLMSHSNAKRSAQFLCLANKSISGKLRPKEWTSTFWNGDRPGIDLVTSEPEAWGSKLMDFLQDADEDILGGLLGGLRAGQSVAEASSESGPVLLAQVAAAAGPLFSGLRRLLPLFVLKVRAGLQSLLEVRKDQTSRETTGMPGSQERHLGRPPGPRRPRFSGQASTMRQALAAAWLDFQHRYRSAALRLKEATPEFAWLGFPKHCLGPPVPTVG